MVRRAEEAAWFERIVTSGSWHSFKCWVDIRMVVVFLLRSIIAQQYIQEARLLHVAGLLDDVPVRHCG